MQIPTVTRVDSDFLLARSLGEYAFMAGSLTKALEDNGGRRWKPTSLAMLAVNMGTHLPAYFDCFVQGASLDHTVKNIIIVLGGR